MRRRGNVSKLVVYDIMCQTSCVMGEKVILFQKQEKKRKHVCVTLEIIPMGGWHVLGYLNLYFNFVHQIKKT